MKIVAQKVVTLVSAPFSLAEGPVSVTASVGGALYPRDGDSVRTLLKNADAAMYAAKPERRQHLSALCPQSVHTRRTCPAQHPNGHLASSPALVVWLQADLASHTWVRWMFGFNWSP